MQKINKIFPLIIFTFFFLNATCQKNPSCVGFYKSSDCIDKTQNDFLLSGQSRSTTFEVGAVSQFDIVLNGGRDYIISCCTESGFYPLSFKIVTVDGGEVIYDNMSDDYLTSIGFTIDNTQTVSIIITLLAEDRKPSDFNENRACVGIAIQFRKTPKLGF